MDLKVVDLEGNEVPKDGKTVGEIIAHGDNVMKGYWKLPQETEKAIVAGYFRTGDLATVDDEIHPDRGPSQGHHHHHHHQRRGEHLIG